MKESSAVIALALCSLLAACTPQDTSAPKTWRRPLEARLSGSAQWEPCRTKPLRKGQLVAETTCGAIDAEAASKLSCDDLIRDRHDAVRLFVLKPECTDAARQFLEPTASNATELNDLAALHYTRAQREDRPADLIRAFEAIERAVERAPHYATAHFNRALIQTSLHLPHEALASWDEFLRRRAEDDEWVAEARRRRAAIVRQLAGRAAYHWPARVPLLQRALAQGDRATVARMIDPYPLAAESYLFEELLPEWAERQSDETLQQAQLLAEAVAQRLGDRFAIDVMAAVKRTRDAAEMKIVREGLTAYRDAMAAWAIRSTVWHTVAPNAESLLTASSNPLQFSICMRWSNDIDALAALGREALQRGYPHVAARVLSSRANHLFGSTRYVESLVAYDGAFAAFIRFRDIESATRVRARRAGILYTIGQVDAAAREGLIATRDMWHLHARERHIAVGEMSAIARIVEAPRAARAYQNTVVTMVEREITAGRAVHLAIARRARANVLIALGDYAGARADLDAAVRLNGVGASDAETRANIQYRIEEANGSLLLRQGQPAAAVQAFTRALELGAGKDYASFVTYLYAQRARAHRLAGDRKAAEEDLLVAKQTLENEETITLEQKRRAEPLHAYFARFRDAVHLLTRHQVEDRRYDQAFDVAEDARTVEMLDLLKRRAALPKEFEKLMDARGTIPLVDLRPRIPAGTVLLVYSVLEDGTYTWIVSRDHFAFLKQNATRRDVERWAEGLHAAVRNHSMSGFEAASLAPYQQLLATPLREVARLLRGAAPQHLVIVPDRAMHAMPLAALRESKRGRYLIEYAPLSVSGSASLYLYSLLRDRELGSARGDVSALLVGNPTFDRTQPFAESLADLPHAESEAARIAGLYAPQTTRTLLRNVPTVETFLRLAPAHPVVHVAAHAVVSADPTASVLYLAQSPADRGGIDAASLVDRLRLERTRLVVLSACSSAGGQPVGAEGVAPLVRPLLAAGAPAVVGTLWNVNDATTPDLMVSFHQHYAKGMDADMALQQAQLDALRNKRAGHRSVLAWGAFQVIGNSSSPFAPPQIQTGGTP